MRRWRRLAVAATLALAGTAAAADKTWDNGTTNFTWDTTSLNWSSTVWSNAAGDGAIFGATGVGPVSVPAGISVNSLSFAADSYTLNGAGSLTFVNGTSTQTTGVINVASGTTTVNVPITSSATAIQKIGAGVLALSAPVNVTASFPVTPNGLLSANVIVGPAPSGTSPVGGTLRLLNSTVLSAASNVTLGAGGILDIGASNVTVGSLTFLNQNTGLTYPGNYGVTGSGTLRVTGEINVVGDISGNNGGNAIDCPIDMGGGTQVIRSATGFSFGGPSTLMITGPISNGSLLKTIGYNQNGVFGRDDGFGLFGNNTYTGSTTINGGTIGNNLTAGTNASTSLKVVNGVLSVQGANGSYGAATTIQVLSGGTLVLDNNAAFGTGVNAGAGPPIPAANNGDRIPDTAVVTLRDGALTYRGLSGAASSETYGSMNVTGGANTLTIAPTGTGTATFAATGNLTLDPRATLQISASSTVLGSTGFVKFGGTVPAGFGSTPIIPRVVSTSDFVFYNATNGFMPLSSYSSTLASGANVALSAPVTTAGGGAGSVSINALKTTATLATTISAGDTLAVATGMIFSTSGTHTISGTGTLAFGGTPGVFFGTITVNAPVTGSQGLLAASGTLTLAGDLSSLTGTVSNIGTGTLNLNTNTLPAASTIEVRRGTLSIGTATLSGTGPIQLGVPQNDTNLLPANPTLSISGAGANAVISRPIIVDNGATNAGGASLTRTGYLPTLSPLSNTTGSQTLSGNITLNTSLNVQGGGASSTSTGATIFAGNISGAGTLVLANGRANFTGDVSNAGGLLIAASGFTGIANFQGTISGGVPIVVNGGSNANTGISYATQANLGTSPITIQNAAGSTAPSIFATANGSINNSITLNGDVVGSVAPGVVATWAGPVTGTGALTKSNTGTLVLSNASTAYTGTTKVNAGTLTVNGNVSTAAVTVASGGTLQGTGTLTAPVTAATGATLKGGDSLGVLTVAGNVSLTADATTGSTLRADGTPTANSEVVVTGATNTFNLAGLTGSNRFTIQIGGPTLVQGTTYTWELARTQDNAAGLLVNGTAGTGGTIPAANYLLTSPNFAAFSSSNLVATPNALVLTFTPVPEPACVLLTCGAAASGLAWRRRRARCA
jgi:fibronectin-binding autotransporter adhesin